MVVSGGVSPICERRLAALQLVSTAVAAVTARSWRIERRVIVTFLCFDFSTGSDTRQGVAADNDLVGTGNHRVDDSARLRIGDADRGAHRAVLDGFALRRELHARGVEHDG